MKKKVGDLILEVDRKPVRGLIILLLVKRGGSTLYLTVRAGE